MKNIWSEILNYKETKVRNERILIDITKETNKNKRSLIQWDTDHFYRRRWHVILL